MLIQFLALSSSLINLFLLFMQGGKSTRDEMCLSFLFYYPPTELATCFSDTQFDNYDPFFMKYFK